MSAMKIELPIDEKARNYAKIYSSMIRDEYQRKRANAAIMALNGYVNHLNKSHAVKIQNSMTLYRNPSLCEQYELADFYVNNYHIDVRVTIDKDTVLLPKIHYDNNIIPDFYVVVKTDRSLNSFELLGIIDAAQMKPQPSDFHYYMANSDSFISNEEFIDRVKNQKPERRDGKEHENFANNYLAFIDNEMNSQRKIQILKHLFNCVDCRTEFCCFSGFEMVNCNAANYPELFDDKTLDIVGAQIDEDSEEYKAKEETIYIGGDEESSQSNQEESIQEEENKESELTLISDDESTDKDNESEENEDILDELFGDEEAETSNPANGIQMQEEEQQQNNETDTKESDNTAINEQKVIIDYDEAGAPIYSYISNTDSEKDSSEIQNIEDDEESSELQLDINDKNVNQELSTIYDEEEYPQNIIETIDEEKENTDTEEAEETKETENENENENTESNENSDEIDIMDQMFVDGALEREAREQQDVSYNPLSTPVDSHIPDEVIEAPEDIEPLEESSIEEQINDEPIEEIKVETNEEELIDESQEAEILTEDEEIETVNENEEKETLIEEEATPTQDNETEIEDNEEEIVENIVEEDVENSVDNSLIEETQEPEQQAVHMFDNYISSEITKNEEEKSELEEDYTHESVENIDDAITYSSENEENNEDEEYDENEEDSEDDYYSEGENGMDFENNSNESSTKRLIITIAVIAVILMAFGAGIFFYLKNKEAAEIPSEPLPAAQEEVMEPNDSDNFELPTIEPNGEIQPSEQNVQEGTSIETIPLETPEISNGIPEINKNENNVKQLTEEDLNNNKDEYKDINKAITKALSGGENLITFKGLNWFCSSALFSDQAFKAYMQSLDNTLKQNLKNNILGITELPPKNQVTVKFAVDNNRNLRKSVITESSGSEELDKIVLRSINETFMGEKSPILSDSPLKADMYYFKVVIKF